ncbi:uncharacterized protein EAF02_010576 [Botrytis sinoallii]|uniref:uncharacterized protein n=1 Tax=Botrytis sinoallii TaxID=1463999 RepID=UPI001901EF1B|nr:uncharacterized protein EAF02_010576 [Botrytis sinoallii]KAF7861622.1 hypothetical protein EAF02_010576 [Botrytis sinoallii]
MAETNHRADDPNTSSHTATENTPLLFPPRNDTPAIEEVLVDDDGDSTGTDVDPNEFDLMLSRTTSFTAIGIEPILKSPSMLSKFRIHHHAKRGSRNSSRVSTRRKSISGSIRSIRETIEDDDEEPKSPF